MCGLEWSGLVYGLLARPFEYRNEKVENFLSSGRTVSCTMTLAVTAGHLACCLFPYDVHKRL